MKCRELVTAAVFIYSLFGLVVAADIEQKSKTKNAPNDRDWETK